MVIIFFMVKIAYPSYISTQAYCEETNYSMPEGYTIAGTFNPYDNKITIYVSESSPQFTKILAHELTHYIQSQEGRLSNCVEKGFSWGVFFNEIEAYLSEYGFYNKEKMQQAYINYFQ